MGKLTFRTIFGGPGMPQAYDDTLDEIEASLKERNFHFDLDFGLTIGGDMITVTHPTGLRNPRIHTDRDLIRGTIFLNNDDIDKQSDHAAFLRHTIHGACLDVFDRMEKKKVAFDKDSEIEKLAFLK